MKRFVHILTLAVILAFGTGVQAMGSTDFTAPTSIQDPVVVSIKVYPNPTADFFKINNDKEVAKVGIYNLVGKQIAVVDHEEGQQHDVSAYRKGIYLIRLIDARGELIKSIRLSKQ